MSKDEEMVAKKSRVKAWVLWTILGTVGLPLLGAGLFLALQSATAAKTETHVAINGGFIDRIREVLDATSLEVQISSNAASPARYHAFKKRLGITYDNHEMIFDWSARARFTYDLRAGKLHRVDGDTWAFDLPRPKVEVLLMAESIHMRKEYRGWLLKTDDAERQRRALFRAVRLTLEGCVSSSEKLEDRALTSLKTKVRRLAKGILERHHAKLVFRPKLSASSEDSTLASQPKLDGSLSLNCDDLVLSAERLKDR